MNSVSELEDGQQHKAQVSTVCVCLCVCEYVRFLRCIAAPVYGLQTSVEILSRSMAYAQAVQHLLKRISKEIV